MGFAVLMGLRVLGVLRVPVLLVPVPGCWFRM
jgi:hypothetical protein